MHRAILGGLAIVFMSSQPPTKPTTATLVTAADIQAALTRAPEAEVSDQQVRMVDAGRANVGIGVLRRSAKATQGAIEHDELMEVYDVLEGSGTLVTGGALVNAKRYAPDTAVVRETGGPSIGGSALRDGESRRIAQGDVVIIPAGVGHGFSAIDGTISYMVVRIDPDKALSIK